MELLSLVMIFSGFAAFTGAYQMHSAAKKKQLSITGLSVMLFSGLSAIIAKYVMEGSLPATILMVLFLGVVGFFFIRRCLRIANPRQKIEVDQDKTMGHDDPSWA